MIKKKLKVAFFVSKFPTISETFIVNQICDLIDKGHQVYIFSFLKGERNIVHEKISNYNLLDFTYYHERVFVPKVWRYLPFLRYLVLNFRKDNFKKILENFDVKERGKKGLNLLFFYRYYWILRHGYFDVLHSHFGENGVYVAEMLNTGLLSSSRFVATFHGYDIQPALLNRHGHEYQKIFKAADVLTVNSVFSKELLQTITEKKITILPVGLDTEFYTRKTIPSNYHFKILFVGRMVEFKGPDLTLQILFHLLKKGHEEIILNMVGDGELKPSLDQKIKELGIESKVRMHGNLTQLEIRDLMESSDLFLMPGIYDSYGRAENQGLVIQEAQAMELPVVISDAGGMKYGIIPGETGYVLKQGEIAEFVDKVEFLVRNKKIRERMGENGRRYVVEHFDSKILGEKLINLYLE